MRTIRGQRDDLTATAPRRSARPSGSNAAYSARLGSILSIYPCPTRCPSGLQLQGLRGWSLRRSPGQVGTVRSGWVRMPIPRVRPCRGLLQHQPRSQRPTRCLRGSESTTQTGVFPSLTFPLPSAPLTVARARNQRKRQQNHRSRRDRDLPGSFLLSSCSLRIRPAISPNSNQDPRQHEQHEKHNQNDARKYKFIKG